MTAPILHYIYDPLCGWCYAAEPLVLAAADAGVAIRLHGGGLWDPGVHASEAKRRSMRETDARIAKLTGQPFGQAYLDGLLVNPTSVWWSRPTIAAVLAAEALQADRGPAMIAAIQRVHYVEGRPVVDASVPRRGRRARSAWTRRSSPRRCGPHRSTRTSRPRAG